MIISDKVLLGSLYVDYLTVTCSEWAIPILSELARENMGIGLSEVIGYQKRMQFKGVTSESSFYGTSEKPNKMAMYQTSGYRAQEVYETFCDYNRSSFNCSRLDVQLTLPLTGIMERVFEKVADNRERLLDKTGRKLRWQYITNDMGYDTLYVGSRMSTMYRRFYIKDVKGEKYLRIETEIKGKLATRVFRSKITYGSLANVWLQSMLFLVYSGFEYTYNLLRALVGTNYTGKIIEIEGKPVVNKEWIEQTLLPYLIRSYEYEPEYIARVAKRLTDYCETGYIGDKEYLLDNLHKLRTIKQ